MKLYRSNDDANVPIYFIENDAMRSSSYWYSDLCILMVDYYTANLYIGLDSHCRIIESILIIPALPDTLEEFKQLYPELLI